MTTPILVYINQNSAVDEYQNPQLMIFKLMIFIAQLLFIAQLCNSHTQARTHTVYAPALNKMELGTIGVVSSRYTVEPLYSRYLGTNLTGEVASFQGLSF